MAAEAAAAERAEKIAQSFETQEVDSFVSDLKTGFRVALKWIADGAARGNFVWRRDLRRLLRIDEAFLRKALDKFVDQVFDFLVVHRIGTIEHFAKFFAHRAFGEEVAFLESAQDGFFQSFERTLRIKL